MPGEKHSAGSAGILPSLGSFAGCLAVSIPLLAAAFAFSSEPAQEGRPQALGSGSCASGHCHGSQAAVQGRNILQNEFRIWSAQDRHAQAYSVLLEQRSQRIAANLKLGAPQKAALCLDCHAFNLPAAQRTPLFDIAEGVGCEACHGASTSWLGAHAAGNVSRTDLGMTDSRQLEQRADVCLSCHLGDGTKSVNHELIAAGHPVIRFELDTFSALMPRHWRQEEGNWEGVQRWAVGQAVALRQSMLQLARRAQGTGWDSWPDFEDFECSSCHHSLVAPRPGDDYLPSPRQARGFEGIPGIPPWDESRYIVFRQLFRVALTSRGSDLESRIAALKQDLQSALKSRSAVASKARSIASVMDRLVPELKAISWDAGMVERLIAAIAARSGPISQAGIRSAEQATWAVDALYASYLRSTGRSNPQLDAQINRLYESLQSAPGYDAGRFSGLLREVEAGQ